MFGTDQSVARTNTRRRAVLRAGAITVVSGLAGCMQPLLEGEDEEVSTNNSDTSSNEGATEEDGSEEEDDPIELTERWETEIRGSVIALGDEKIFVGNNDELVALSFENGERSWRTLQSESESRFGVTNDPRTGIQYDDLYILGFDNQLESASLYQVDTDDGEIENSYYIDGSTGGLIPNSDELILDTQRERDHEIEEGNATHYCNYGGGEFITLSPELEELSRIDKPNELCRSRSSAAGGGSIIIEDNPFVYSIDESDGSVHWRKDFALRDDPIVTDDAVFLPTLNEGLKRINIVSGEEVWTFDDYNYGERSASVAKSDRAVYACQFALHSLDPADGEVNWTTVLPEEPLEHDNAVRTADGVVWILTGEYLLAYDEDDGEKLLEKTIDAEWDRLWVRDSTIVLHDDGSREETGLTVYDIDSMAN